MVRSFPRSGERRPDSPNFSAPRASTNSSEVKPTIYAAYFQDTDSGQVLTVVAKPEQTLKEISLLYAGRFDPQLLKEICGLNPKLKDPDHIEAGQLIQLPLPPGTLRKGIDTSEVTSAPKGETTETKITRVRALLGVKRW